MSFLSSLNIGGSALTAQSFRMDIISQNIASANITRTASGEPYRRKQVVFEERGQQSFRNALTKELESMPGNGVRVKEVVEDQSDLQPVYDPAHPHADEDGYVWMPNVNTAQEMMDMMSATSSYQANITAINAVKGMAIQALQIGK